MDEKDIKPSDVDQLEEQILAARKQRVDEKVEAGTAIRAPITIVTAGPEDADDALVSMSANKITELHMAGERREIIFEPQQIFTGVPRPARDPKYSARLEKELAAQTVEQRQQEEAAAVAVVESFHEGARDHTPEPPPAPMPKSVIAEPPSDLQWTGVIAPISGPSAANPAGRAVEGRFGVADFVLFVADAEGRLLTSRVLQPGDDPKAIARVVLRERLKPNPFYSDLPYK
jgi:hypothetical protein